MEVNRERFGHGLVECVPNFSEGRDRSVILAILQAMHVEDVRLLDWSMDADHNRSVITIAGPPEAVLEAAVRGAAKASQRIDLTAQTGVHPRIGAADVIPFVPLTGTAIEQCALLAHACGRELWQRAGVPSYFYEAAALRPDRSRLEEVRKGQFEQLRRAVLNEASRKPDIGGPGLHPTAGASAIGARGFLIAYNIYLDSPDVALARAIARKVRAADGGFPGVKALGMLVEGRAQVSLNITDFKAAGPGVVHAAIEQLANAQGVHAAEGELIGLLPEAAYEQNALWVRQLDKFDPAAKILERRLDCPLGWPAE